MKLFYFKPSTYGPQWFVMAATREEAIACVISHREKDKDVSERDYNLAELNEMISGLNGAGIFEYNKGQVIESEIA